MFLDLSHFAQLESFEIKNSVNKKEESESLCFKKQTESKDKKKDQEPSLVHMTK
jgi:hypothetical protein